MGNSGMIIISCGRTRENEGKDRNQTDKNQKEQQKGPTKKTNKRQPKRKIMNEGKK